MLTLQHVVYWTECFQSFLSMICQHLSQFYAEFKELPADCLRLFIICSRKNPARKGLYNAERIGQELPESQGSEESKTGFAALTINKEHGAPTLA